MAAITAIRMPKWGLSMQEGTIVNWWQEEGAAIAEGDDLVDIETTKITNVFQSPQSGLLRKIVAAQGETLPVGALIGVLADATVDDGDIDAFVAEFQAKFVPGESLEETAALALSTIEAGRFHINIGRAGSGDGTPAVLIHGFSGDLNNWLFNIEPLAAKRPVVALDLPGHGASSKDVGDGSLATLAGAVKAALEALGIARAHLIGHSLGAAVAARLAADAPGLAASLTLICPAEMPGTRVSEEFLNGMVEARRARDLKPMLEMLFADPGLVTKNMVEDMLKFKRLDGAEEALAILRDRLLAGEDAARLAQDLGAIGAATVIVSEGDRIVGVPDERALPSRFEIVRIAGAGHMPHLEKSAEVNAILGALSD
jgi:pyruvate dehydrogenase E2 component (dihydrolipoamide acetyltransferase)